MQTLEGISSFKDVCPSRVFSMIVKSLRKFVSAVSSSSSFAEWDTGLSADLDVTSDHDGSGYTLVLTWDKPLSSFEQWSGTASSSDQMWVFLGS